MTSLVDSAWELVDPNPDIFSLFVQFDREFFKGQLGSVEVKWSKRMTLCAGLCRYTGKMGLCTIVLSEPLLKLRPRKDLIETLLHEMIHAYLFVADNNREHDAHGPKFVSFMEEINRKAGTRITVYHSFHDEVNHYKTHWWKCDGPCQKRPPFYGMVKRSMNRKPGPHDFWYSEHQKTCGGNFVKIREPEPKTKPKLKGHVLGDGVSERKKNPGSKLVSSKIPDSRKIEDFFQRRPGESSSIKSGSSQSQPRPSPTSTYTPTTATTSSPSDIAWFPGSSSASTNGFLNQSSSTSVSKQPTGTNGSYKVPSNLKENKGKDREKGKPIQKTIPSGNSTVTVITLDDDDEKPNPVKPVQNSQTDSINSMEHKPDKYHFKKQENPSGSSFVPFSGKGNVLGSSSSIKKPRLQ